MRYKTTFLLFLKASYFRINPDWIRSSNELLNFELEKKTPFLLIPLFFSVVDVKFTLPKIMKIVVFGACFIVLSLLIFAGYQYFQTSDSEVFYYHNLVSVVNGNAIYYSLFFSSALLFAFELLISVTLHSIQ
jgi:hypothetical protein